MPDRLSRRFYRRPTEVVARALLGKVLVHGDKRARITECEAYLGPEDLASHARFGRTKRSRVMFEGGGLAYVYLCYGMHNMFNVVTEHSGRAGAVLVRAVTMLGDRAPDPKSSNGPGKLTRALGLDLTHNGTDLTRADHLYISRGADARRVPAERVVIGPRIGIDYAGEWAGAPLRFVMRAPERVSRDCRGRRSR